MSVIVTITLPAEDFTLGSTLTANPGIRVELERVIPVGDTFFPYFWAADDDIESIEAALRNEADIESFTVVDTANSEALVRVEWATQLDGFLDALVQTNATILEGIGEVDTWRFQLRFDTHDDLTVFYRSCIEHDISLNFESIHNPGIPRDHGREFDLTDLQRETLQIAFEEGYFDVPRRSSLVELADELNISDSAVSQRLRRGIAALLSATFFDSDESAFFDPDESDEMVDNW